MIATKKIGIWMNHSIAHIMDFTAGLITTKTIESRFDDRGPNVGLSNNETKAYFKDKNLQDAFYKKLGEALHGYKEVILFGPTYSKVKLYNILSADSNFANTKIGITHAENMTKTEQHDFVMNHFSRRESLV